MAFDMELSKRIFLAVDGEVALARERLDAVRVRLEVVLLLYERQPRRDSQDTCTKSQE